ncbi:MAG: efflux RND transporter permease subunit, partial [Candidatus Pacebacteria bacterium]|nr:efflux RND transporter permease subunit [Candidatus Paceibacterota bacterium]
EHYFLAIGLSRGGPGKVNEGISFVTLVPVAERDKHQSQVMQDVRQQLAQLPDGRAFVMEPSMGPGGGAPLQVVLQHASIEDLAQAQENVMQWMRSQPDYVSVNSDLKLNKPQVTITVDRDQASEQGITVADISNTLRYMLGEPDISTIERDSERYDVITESTDKGNMVPDMLRQLYVRNAEGELVSLGSLVNLEEGIGPSEIHHFNRRRSVTISASPPPGVALGDALNKLQMYLDETLGAGFTHTVTGMAQTFRESFYYLTITIIFSVIFIYLVLSAQFESFLYPLTILISLPLATIGAFGALWALDMTFNILSFIGLIMLLGIVTKNAILLVDFTNVLRARGRALFEAAQEAARVRFRPVLMTAISTILGMLPIALGFGAGGEARAPLGVCVSVGMISSTALTLIVIPVVYTFFDQIQTGILKFFGKR